MVLSKSGHVYTFGRAAEGQLGREVPVPASARRAPAAGSGPTDDLILRWRPARVEKLSGQRMVGICASETMSFAWDGEGNLYEWGTRFQEQQEPGSDGNTDGSGSPADAKAAADPAVPGSAPLEDTESAKAREDREFEMAQIVLPGLAAEAPRDSVRRMVVKSAMRYLAAGSGIGGGQAASSGRPSASAGEVRASAPAQGEGRAAADRCDSSAGTEASGSSGAREGDEGVLGAQLTIEHVPLPRVHRQLQRLGVRVRHVAAGYRHAVVVDTAGRAWSQGFNDRGQLGLRHRFPLPHFRQVREGNEEGDAPRGLEVYVRLPRFRKAACGAAHTLLLDDGGRLWACGSGGLGQLGLRVARTRLEPARLAAFPNIREADRLECEKVAAARLRAGPLGAAEGHGGGAESEAGGGLAGVKMPPRARVVDISCGQNHSIAVTDDGTLWGWGHSEYHQMGAMPSMSSGERILRSAYFYVPRPLGVTHDVSAVMAVDGHGMPEEEEPEEVRAAEAAATAAAHGSKAPFSAASSAVVPPGSWHATGGATLPLRGSMASSDRLVAAAKAGSLMGAALTREGRLVTFGWQGWGALGRGAVSAQVAFSPVAAPLPFHRVTAFGVGDSHALCTCPALGDRHALSFAPLLRDPDLLGLASVTLWPAKRVGQVGLSPSALSSLRGAEASGAAAPAAFALSAELLGGALSAAQRRAEEARKASAAAGGGGRTDAQERARRSAEQRERRMQDELQGLMGQYADRVVAARSNRDPGSYAWVSRGKFDNAARKLASRLSSRGSRRAADSARARAEAAFGSGSRNDRRAAQEAARGHVTDIADEQKESAGMEGEGSFTAGGVDSQLAKGLAPKEPVGWLVVASGDSAAAADGGSAERSADPESGLVQAEACIPAGNPLLVHGEMLLARCPVLAAAAQSAAKAAVASADGKSRVVVEVPSLDERLASEAAGVFLAARGGIKWSAGGKAGAGGGGGGSGDSDSGGDAPLAEGTSSASTAVGGLSIGAAEELKEAAKAMKQRRERRRQRRKGAEGKGAAAAESGAGGEPVGDSSSQVDGKKERPKRRRRRRKVVSMGKRAGAQAILPACVVSARVAEAGGAKGEGAKAAGGMTPGYGAAEGEGGGSRLELEVVLPGVPDRVLEALVTYLYLDTVRVRGNVRGELGALARRLGLGRLASICAGRTLGLDGAGGEAGGEGGDSKEAGDSGVPGGGASSFRRDMGGLFAGLMQGIEAGGDAGAEAEAGAAAEAIDRPWAHEVLLDGQGADCTVAVRAGGAEEDTEGRRAEGGDAASPGLTGSASGAGSGAKEGGAPAAMGHTALLSRFDFFKAALIGGMSKAGASGEAREVTMPGAGSGLVRRILRWTYDGDADAAMGGSGESALETLVAARQLMLGRLCDAVEEAVVEAVDAENASFLRELAELHGFQRLMRACDVINS